MILFIQRLFSHRCNSHITIFIQSFSQHYFYHICYFSYRGFPTWKLNLKNETYFVGHKQNIFIQRLFKHDSFHTEVIPTQRLYPQHNIHAEFSSTLLLSTVHFHTEHFLTEIILIRLFSYRGYLHKDFSFQNLT